MKINSINIPLILSLILFCSDKIIPQPGYTVSARNGALINDNNYEFDIYILRTGTQQLELASLQVSIYFSDAIRNGGTLTGEYISGSSGLSNSAQYPVIPNLSFTINSGSVRQFRIASTMPPGTGNGSIISNISPGTRFGRFRITNTTAFNKNTPVGWQWNFLNGTDDYASYINAYIGTTNTNITSQTNFEINLHDPLSSALSFQLTVAIGNGWNLVSIPGLHPVDQNIDTWWQGRDQLAGVFKFDNGYLPVITVNPTSGYWMKHIGMRVYNTGEEWPGEGILLVSHNPVSADAGWNLVGGYEYNAAVSGITTNPPGLVEGYVFGYAGGYNPVSEIVPGYAYWIKLSGSGELILPPSSLNRISKADNIINKDWGKIIILDNSGKSYTLYIIKSGDANLKMFELPPPPPHGIFDVRFGSGRFAEKLKNNIQIIEMNGVDYPVKIKAENVDIKLQDESGKILNTKLKPGEEVLINSSINKLIVSEDIIPDKYSIEQNYPNPFNPVTTIKYFIPDVELHRDASIHVNLKVYDILGGEVAILVNEEKKPGIYEVEFDASQLSSGIYFYQLRTGDFILTRKMVLTK